MHKPVLKVKSREETKNWLRVWLHYKNHVSFDHILRRQAEAVSRIQSYLTPGRRCAYAYSGGKDGQVLRHLARLAGVELGMIGMMEELELPAFENWVMGQIDGDPGITIVRTPFTHEWLQKNPERLFPARLDNWLSISIWEPQNRYIRENNIDVMFYGRRTKDGNFCGPKGVSKKGSSMRISPIYDWSHEEVLGYMQYLKLELAPPYFFPMFPALVNNWWHHGPHAWPKLEIDYHNKTREQVLRSGWDVLFQLDATIVERAAKYFETAENYLKEG